VRGVGRRKAKSKSDRRRWRESKVAGATAAAVSTVTADGQVEDPPTAPSTQSPLQPHPKKPRNGDSPGHSTRTTTAAASAGTLSTQANSNGIATSLGSRPRHARTSTRRRHGNRS
jgi:hypothetical protein